MMCIDNGDDLRQWRCLQFSQKSVHVPRNPVKVIVGVDLSKMRRLDVPPAEVWRCHGDLIHSSPTAARLEIEIALRVRFRVADGNGPDPSARARDIDPAAIAHTDEPAGQAWFNLANQLR